jgi:hypothetical protein
MKWNEPWEQDVGQTFVYSWQKWYALPICFIPLLMDRYYNRLLPLFRQFLLILNGNPIVWIKLECDQNWSTHFCPNWDMNPVLYWMETHSVDQARVGPKLKHTVVSQLGYESRTSLNENHSQLPCDNPRDAPVWRGTERTYGFGSAWKCW